MFKIIVERRSDDYKAYLEGDSKTWECGKTEAEAIGKLIILLASVSGAVEVVRPPSPEAPRLLEYTITWNDGQKP